MNISHYGDEKGAFWVGNFPHGKKIIIGDSIILTTKDGKELDITPAHKEETKRTVIEIDSIPKIEMLEAAPGSHYYMACDSKNEPMLWFSWAGFNTNTTAMKENGWLRKILHNVYTKKYLIRYYHPQYNLTFTIKVDSLDNLDGKSFQVKVRGGGKHPVRLRINELTPAHIPELLEAVVQLQKPIRNKQIQEMQLPKAQVVSIREARESA